MQMARQGLGLCLQSIKLRAQLMQQHGIIAPAGFQDPFLNGIDPLMDVFGRLTLERCFLQRITRFGARGNLFAVMIQCHDRCKQSLLELVPHEPCFTARNPRVCPHDCRRPLGERHAQIGDLPR